MNDLQSVAIGQQGGAVGVTRNDVAIVFDNHSGRSNLQLFKQTAEADPVRDHFFFAVYFNLHKIKKPYSLRPPEGGQGIRFQVCPAFNNQGGTLTFTLPYAGATRIRFEGLPVI